MSTETSETYNGSNEALRHALRTNPNLILSEVIAAHDVGDGTNPLANVSDDPAIIRERVIEWKQVEAQRNGVPARDLLAINRAVLMHRG